jgi:hypothetical protein
LPADTRPPAGSLLVTVSASASLLSGIPAAATEDGWSVSFDRFLLGLGRVSLEGEACTSYSEARYSRIFDMLLPEPQKVSEQFALGQCDFEFDVVTPSSEALLGEGVTGDDAVFMRTPGMDQYAGVSGISIYVQGRARRGGVEKTFAWPFRWELRYEQCELGGQSASGVALSGGQAQVVDIQIGGEELFRDEPEPALAKFRFQPFADADGQPGDDDGEVTLDELGQFPLSGLSGGYRLLVSAQNELSARAGSEPTLQDYLYLVGFPSVPRFLGSGACRVELGGGDGRRGD